MLNEEEGIIVVVATKNRVDLLKNALESIFIQTKKPLDVFVASDSIIENEIAEKDLCSTYGFHFLKDIYTHNYAGNLNTAIEGIFAKYAYDNRYDLNNLFIAFLDDDDIWHKEYLRECWNAHTTQTDIVVCGLNYHSDEKTFPLAIPHDLSIDSFLKGNPHVQGSNTFVKFSTLLKAGCFDENLDSTTDRDLFTRLFMLKPNIGIVDKYLVEVDASNTRGRLTNNREGKRLSLAKFYYKYGFLMSDEIKKEFFNRVTRFTDTKNEEELLDSLNKDISFNQLNDNKKYKYLNYFPKLCFSFITTDINYAKRLIKDIIEADYPSKKIVVFANFESLSELNELTNLLNATCIEYSLLSLKEAKKLAETKYFDKFVSDNFPKDGIVNEISVARSILQYFSYKKTRDDDVIYVVDEDMQLSSIYREFGKFEIKKADMKGFVSCYLGKADAVIGSYAGDAPIPALSTLRSSLLDYVYSLKLGKNKDSQEQLYFKRDYYYSFSDEGNICNETPFPLIESCTLKDVLGGKAVSRPLFEHPIDDFEPIRRGGNTLIFNRRLLLVPNFSIKIGDYVSRRGDSLWIILAKIKGYKIIGSSFSLFQNRLAYDFNLNKELQKETLDILGYSMISAISKEGFSSRTDFYKTFSQSLKDRTIRFAISYFRVIGLLKILNDESYDYLENDELVYDFIRKIKELDDISKVNAGFDELRSYISLDDKKNELEKIESFLINKCKCNNPILLGYGLEAAVYKSNSKTYKVYFRKDNLDFFKSIVNVLNDISGFPKNISFNDSLDYAYCSYDTINNFKKYEGGYAKELARFINELRLRGLVITNFKKENLLISHGEFFYIDLGKDIVPYSEKEYKRSVERCYQMIKFSSLNEHQFRILISKSYQEESTPLNYAFDVFNELINDKKKEQTHDPIILNLINKHRPGSVLDYGAGKCKIANSISDKFNTFVFDVDYKIIKERASNKVTIIDDIKKVNRTFDLINCNKVLCCTDEATNDFILGKINQLLSKDGRLILSICNPFFDVVNHTVTSIKNYVGKYENSSRYQKITIYGNREEFHRTFSYYERLLKKHGFNIEAIYEDKGIDTASLSFIGEHLIFDCHKSNKTLLNDCTLLIKANPMEANTIYENVRHIVSQLEKNNLFAERILTIDIKSEERARRYALDDFEKFQVEINKLKNDGYIDRIVSLDLPNDYSLYEKYFGLMSSDAHSENGQGLLATLKGFESVRTRYVFQTDSDIIYFNDGSENLNDALNVLKENNALTLSLSIAHNKKDEAITSKRTEVRSSFIDLKKLYEKLPLSNELVGSTLKDCWHRVLDKSLKENESLRLISNHLFFIHPENKLKKVNNFISIVRKQVENDFVPSIQIDYVNLNESYEWVPQTNKEVIIFIRGRNIPTTKLKRLFDSLEVQCFSNFQIVYIDDNSTNISSSEYVRALAAYSPIWKDRIIYIKNETRVGSLANFEFFYKRICINPKSIIINIDSDDALIKSDALRIIKEEFDKGHDVTVGNCFRLDKPLKKYDLVAFKHSWKRNGDNIWLHPKCFRRYLCGFIQDSLIKDNEYIDVGTDYAMMLPIVEHSYSPSFIKEQIYLFDASNESQNKQGVYKNNSQQKMKQWLLNKAKNLSQYPTIAVIGDGSILEDSNEYKIAFELGKSLAELGYNIKNGGLGGVMEAVFKGAKASLEYRIGSTIAVIPSNNINEVNDFADIVLPTGLDLLRNGLVVDADAVVVIGGGAGTLSEIALAWQKYKLIIALNNVDGWGKKLAGQKLDSRIRYQNIPEDCIYSANDVNDVISLLSKYLCLYTKKYHGIKWRKK